MNAKTQSPDDASALGSLLPNQLFLRRSDKRHLRIIDVDREGDRCVVFEVNSESAVPEFRRYTEVADQIALGDLEYVLQDPFLPREHFTLMSPTRQDFANKRHKKIKPLLDLGWDLFNPQKRSGAIRKLEKSKSCYRATAYKLVRMWWSRGMTLAALITDHDRCGVSDKPRADPKEKPGAKRSLGNGVGWAVPNEHKLLMRAAMTPGQKGTKLTLEQGYSRYLIRHHGADAVLNKDGIVVAREGSQDRVPTREQFKYHTVDSRELLLQKANRRLRRCVRSEVRIFVDAARRSALLPGSRFEIDATILDVYLVSRFDRNRIVGRPTLYVVVDVFSGLIVGIALSLYPPSWVNATKAIVNCLEDKVAMCNNLGFPSSAGLWAQPVMAAQLLGDRGEMQSRLSSSLAAATGTTLMNTSAYFPEGKGTVEGTFNCIQAPMAEFVEGYVCKDFQPRTDPDYRLDATLTLPEAFALVGSCAALRNITPRHRRTIDPDLNSAGVPAVPIEVWQYAVEKFGCAGRAFEPEAVQMQLLPHKPVTMTRHGLHLGRGMYYGSASLAQQFWFIDALARKRPINAIWNPDLTTHIYIPNPLQPRDLYTADLVPRCAKFAERSFVEMHALARHQRVLDEQAQHKAIFQAAGLHDFQRRLIEQAHAAKKAQYDPRMSDAERTRNIAAYRAMEAAATTVEAAYRPPVEQAGPSVSVPGSASAETDRLAERSARRRQALVDEQQERR